VNPLTSLYGIATATRNHVYDRGILKAHKLSRPVISVGNISVGGSGKTPFVIMLGELLKQRGIPFDVLSRGYGRKTRGTMLVDPNGTPHDFGDEPILIARRLQCPVFVSESRFQGGKIAEHDHAAPIATNDHVGTTSQPCSEQSRMGCSPGQRPGPLHILDDGFQHRSLARDFDIVLLTREDLRDQLLPAGRLREPLTSLRRADAIVLTEEIDPACLPAGKDLWRIRRSLSIPPAPPAPKNPIAFCGIARPEKFVEQLLAAGIQPVTAKFFSDHHRYTDRDIRDLLELKNRYSADGFIATQKDAINLGQKYVPLAPIIFPPVKMELVDPTGVVDTILRVITERRAKA
jgi:tetraacyldisaccharide 4'-kinase